MTGGRPWDPDDPWDPDRIVSERFQPKTKISHACATFAHHDCLLDDCQCGCHGDEMDDDDDE